MTVVAHDEAQSLKARIFSAAIAVFAEHGLSGARMEQIATEAQTTKRMVVYYFKSKEQLYQEVLQHVYARIRETEQQLGLENVHFVDQVDLVAPAARRVLHVVEQLAGILDLGPARGVHFDQVDEAAFVDFATDRAFAARRGADPGLAVQALGQDPRDGGLADPAGTGEQVGMVQPLVVQGVDQSLEHMGLADHFTEGTGTPFTRKN